jgi:hypothetical protein
MGDVSITKNGTFHLINASSKNQIILDNLSLNGNNVGATQHLIYLNSVNNFTINDVQVYNSASH